jgi:hypothetical protein
VSNDIVKTKNKGSYQVTTGSDLDGIDNIVLQAIRNCGGRPAEYENSKQGLEKFQQKTADFFQHIADVNEGKESEKALIPDIELWAAYLGVSRQTLWKYGQRNSEWARVIDYFKNIIAAYKKELAQHYKIPPMVFAFDMTNNHQYLNTSEFKITAEQVVTTEQQKQADLEQEIADSGLVWNDKTGTFEEM